MEGHKPTWLDSSTEAPDSPPISIQLPFSPSPFEKACAPTQVPLWTRGAWATCRMTSCMNYVNVMGIIAKIRRRFRRPGWPRRTGQNAGSTQDLQENSEAPSTGTGKRGRPPEDVAEHLQGPAVVRDTCRKRDALRAAVVAGKDVVTEQAQ